MKMTRVFALLFLFGVLVAQDTAGQDTTGQAGGNQKLGVEEVKAKAELRIEDAKKPPLKITPNAFSPVDSVIQAKERLITVQSVEVVERAIDQTVKSHSPYIRVPVEGDVIQSQVRIPLPKIRRKDIARWKVEIVNSLGERVATREGTGRPPDAVTWDGRFGTRQWILPGEPYSYRLVVETKDGARRSFVGTPFKVQGFALDTGTDYRMRVSLGLLFEPRRSELSSGAEPVLTALLNHVKEHNPQQVEVHLYAKETYLMQPRLEELRRYFEKYLPLQPGALKFQSHYLTGSPSYEMLEVVVR